MARLVGKVALITGGSSGIGRATAQLFAKEGASVLILDIDVVGARNTVEHIEAEGGSAVAFGLDVSSEEQWIAAVDFAEAQFGKVNIVCNIAGIGAMSDFAELSLAQWNRELGVNLTGVFLGCKHGIRAIRKSGETGALVNMGSISALRGVPRQAAYCASKAGVSGLTKAVGLYCAEQKLPIRCNAIHPSYVDTAIYDPYVDFFPSRDAMLEQFAKDVPIGRVASPEDIARTALFLASDDSAMITATEIIVDGGQTSGIRTSFEG